MVRIYIKPDHTTFSLDFEEAEVLTSNERFFHEGSGAFIKKDNAMKHFLKLSKELHRGVKKLTRLDTDLPENDRSNRYELIETDIAV